MKNLFFTFEGTEGSGKTTVIKKIAEKLEKQKIAFLVTKEPGDKNLKITKQIRDLIFENNEITNLTEIFLFQADRSEHVEKIIKPNIQKSVIILCDRFIDSNLVYQSGKNNEYFELINNLNKISSQSIIPNKTFFLNIDPTSSLTRIKKDNKREKNRFDLEDLDYHNEIYEKYLKLCETSDRFISIEANRNIEIIVDEIFNIILEEYNKNI